MTPPAHVILGAGGHAKVLLALARAAGLAVAGLCDPALAAAGVAEWRGIPVLGGDEALGRFDPGQVWLINGVGKTVGGTARRTLYLAFRGKGFRFPALVHPAAWVAPGVELADGVQVMAGAVIQPDCRIGENSIVNTCASIDHDAQIGAHVHIAPGATLCGEVKVGDNAFVASGATVIQGIAVGDDAVVGAGVTLVRDLAPARVLIGAAPRRRA